MSSFIKTKTKLPIILILLITSFSTPVFAQKATSLLFDKSIYYQGDSGKLSVTIFNNWSDFQISTKQCYLQFDWQMSTMVFDSGAYPIIGSGSSFTFEIPFNIPSDAAVGNHQFNVVWVDKGILLGKVVVASGSLLVHDAYEKVYFNLLSSVNDKLNTGYNANYKSPEAQSLVNQAKTAHEQAISYANQGKFQDAIASATTMSNLFDQAAVAEKSYVSNPLTLWGNPTYWYFIVAAIILIIALFYIFKKKPSEKLTT